MESKTKVLFICQHNSGRSQIAEAFLKQLHGDLFEVESAGLDPAKEVNPIVVTVMDEVGIDLSRKKPQGVFQLYKNGNLYHHVITVCDNTESQCPIFPGITKRWHWPFPDPAAVKGTKAERLEQVRKIRDMIKEWLINHLENQSDFKVLFK